MVFFLISCTMMFSISSLEQPHGTLRMYSRWRVVDMVCDDNVDDVLRLVFDSNSIE